MAGRDDFAEGMGDTGWNKYSRGYQDAQLFKKAFAAPPTPEPIYIRPASKAVDLGPTISRYILDQPRTTGVAVRRPRYLPDSYVDSADYSPSYDTSSTSDSMFEPEWWLADARLGPMVDAGTLLKESFMARVITGLIVAAVMAVIYTSTPDYSLVICILICIASIALGACIPIAIGFVIEKSLTAAGHALAYASIGLAGAFILGAIVGVGFLIVGAFGHNTSPVVKAASVVRTTRAPAHHQTSKRHGKKHPTLVWDIPPSGR